MASKNWVDDIPENKNFEWIKTSEKHPCPHQIILFVDGRMNFHYGVLCSEQSGSKNNNKYWCHITSKAYSKKTIQLWSYVPEKEAVMILKPYLTDEFVKLQNNLWDKIMQIENEILADIKNDECKSKPYSQPGVIVRNSLSRFVDRIMMMNLRD